MIGKSDVAIIYLNLVWCGIGLLLGAFIALPLFPALCQSGWEFTTLFISKHEGWTFKKIILKDAVPLVCAALCFGIACCVGCVVWFVAMHVMGELKTNPK